MTAGHAEAEFMACYRDGRDIDCPEPSANRSHAYRHSFDIGRAELANKPIPYAVAIARAADAEAKDIAQ